MKIRANVGVQKGEKLIEKTLDTLSEFRSSHQTDSVQQLGQLDKTDLSTIDPMLNEMTKLKKRQRNNNVICIVLSSIFTILTVCVSIL